MPHFLTRPWTLQRFTLVLAGASSGLIAAFFFHGRL